MMLGFIGLGLLDFLNDYELIGLWCGLIVREDCRIANESIRLLYVSDIRPIFTAAKSTSKPIMLMQKTVNLHSYGRLPGLIIISTS